MTTLITRIKKNIPILIAGILFACTQLAHASPEIQHWQNAQGSQVFFVAAPELPMVDIRITFDAGSARDGNKPGLALMTNGLLAEGAGKLDANAIAERFEDIGAKFRNNADRDTASLSLRSLSDTQWLKPAVDNFVTVLSEPNFPGIALERERQRALIALRGEKQSPQSLSSNAFYANIYNDHAYAAPTLGYEENMATLARGDIQTFYQKYYTASNATIAIVGDLDRKEAESLANTLTAKLKKGEKPAAIKPVAYTLKNKQIHIEYPSTQTHIMVGMPSHIRGDKDHFALFVGNHVLGGGGFGSRITKAIREDRGLAYSAYSYFAPMRAQGPFVVGLQTSNTQTKEALQVLNETVATFIKEGPDDNELAAAKRDIVNGFPLRIASNSSVLNYVSLIGFYGLPLDYLNEFTEKVDNITKEQVREAFANRIKLDQLLTVTVGQSTDEG
ncbi:MAG: peptidase M16 [Gammaproteobacteria bacterium]|nr:MAG: peptidase M16 [Gammaproteobacteria bacterium]